MSSRSMGLNENVHNYLLSVSLRDDALLQRLREETSELPMAMMQISAEQGQFMGLLVQLIQARRCLEVGVFTGYSSLVVAKALPPEGRITACDVSDEWTSIARRYWNEAGVADKIELHLGPAVETLDRLIAERVEPYDFAFIDADKENYPRYYEQALKLVRPGGLIGFDNMLWGGRVADPAVNDESTVAIREVNARIASDDRVVMALVPIGDGLNLAMKR